MQKLYYKNLYNEDRNFEQTFLKIKKIILGSNSLSLSYYANESLINDLSLIITEFLIGVNDKEIVMDNINQIIDKYDYRILSDYLRSIKLNEDVSLFDHIDSDRPDYYISQHTVDFFNEQSIDLVEKNSLSELFSETGENYYFYAKNSKGKQIIDCLVKDSNGNIGSYIEQQKDLAGMFSLVRKGLIKKVQLSDGQYIITKKNNPEKKGKFENEQKIVSEVSKRLGFGNNSKIKYADFCLSLISPLAVIAMPCSDTYYSIMLYQPGRTLEEILLAEQDAQARAFHFKNIRQILETLYNNGIIWTDMAPRNIIVDETEDIPTYYILDFEKSKILSEAATKKERAEHLRGPVCVEEFGAVCSLNELKQIFDFDPDKWDLSSEESVPFEKPKRELLAIFEGRNQHNFTFGQYNKLEQEVLKVRLPIISSNQIFYPLHCSFKVDHYLGADYDRKLTEVFLSANKLNLFVPVIKIIETLLELSENRIITDEFISLCSVKTDVPSNTHNLPTEKLKDIIDNLYSLKDNKKLFSEFINRLDFKRIFLKNYVECFSVFGGIDVCKKNYSAIETELLDVFKHLDYSDNIKTIFLSGGYGRGEITPSSDIDVAVIGKDTDEIKKSISDNITSALGMEVEYYPFSDENFQDYIINNPQYLIDVVNCKLIYSTKSSGSSVKSTRDTFLNNRIFLRKVIDTYLERLKKEDDLKLLLESINVVLYLFKSIISKDFYEILAYYKNILISNKLHRYYHDCDFIFYPKQLERILGDTIIILENLKENLI